MTKGYHCEHPYEFFFMMLEFFANVPKTPYRLLMMQTLLRSGKKLVSGLNYFTNVQYDLIYDFIKESRAAIATGKVKGLNKRSLDSFENMLDEVGTYGFR